MLKKEVPLWVFILALLAVTSIAFAIIRTQWSIHSGFQVHVYELKVYETDGVTECHDIDWGCLGQGSSELFWIYVKIPRNHGFKVDT